MASEAFDKIMRGLEEERAYEAGEHVGFRVTDDIQQRTRDRYPVDKMREAAFSYLGEWWTTDRYHHNELKSAVSDSKPERGAKTLSSFAQRYGISRTLSGVSMALVFGEIASLQRSQDVVGMVNNFALKLSAGKTLPTSAASKLLWLRFRDGISIYDSLACMFIEQPYLHHAEQSPFRWSSDKHYWYGQFVERWKIHYGEASQVIKDACSEIVQIKDFTAEKLPLAANYFDIVSEEWFKQRVFDHYIQAGAETHEAR